eukprot:Skav224836  [mRNA]  locus=scaffold3408:242379:243145:- [translate_table: standard]
MILKLPVAEVKMSTLEALHACLQSADRIDLSDQPAPLMAKAQPFPTSPYPATRARLPPIMTSVARMMLPSHRRCRILTSLRNRSR